MHGVESAPRTAHVTRADEPHSSAPEGGRFKHARPSNAPGAFTLAHAKLILSTYLGATVDSTNAPGLAHLHVFRRIAEGDGHEPTASQILVRPTLHDAARSADEFLSDQLGGRNVTGKSTYGVEEDLLPCLERMGLPTDEKALEELRKIADELTAHEPAATARLDTLPPELFLEILGWLPPEDLRNLREFKRFTTWVDEYLRGNSERVAQFRSQERREATYQVRDLAKSASSAENFREGLLALVAARPDFGVTLDENELHSDRPCVQTMFSVLADCPQLRSFEVSMPWQGRFDKLPSLLKSLTERRPELCDVVVSASQEIDADYVHALAAVPGLTCVSVRIAGDVTSAALAALAAKPSLTELTVWGEAGTPECAAALGPVIATHESIRELRLQVRLNDESLRAVAGGLAGNRSLKLLAIGSGPFGAAGLRALGEALETSTTIEHLLIGAADDPDAIEGIASGLGRNSSIQFLELKPQPLSRRSSRSLADALSRNTTLKVIDLFECRIDNGGVSGIAQMLRSNRVLRELDLCLGGVESTSAHMLADGLRHNEMLRKLHVVIRLDPGSAVDLEGLAQSLLEHPRLEELSLCIENMAGSLGPRLLQLRNAADFEVRLFS